jgi:prophage tail gpP-like protein
MGERNISRSQVEKILSIGDYEHNQGALVFSRTGVNLSVVVDGDTVVTVYRKTGRKRKRKNRKRKSWPGRRYTL